MTNKLFKQGLMGITILSGIVAFTGCSSDEQLDNPPMPTGPQSAVKTEFAVSIGSGSRAGTRQGADIVQGQTTPVFRGIQDIAIATGVFGTDLSSTKITSWINLGNITNTELSTSKSSKVYSDVTVPVSTDVFLFYGKAIVNDSQGQNNGYTNFSAHGTVGNPFDNAITFSTKTIVTGGELVATDEAKHIIAALNKFLGAITDDGIKASFFSGNAGSGIAVLKRVQNLVTNVDGQADESDITALFTTDADVQRVFSLSGSGEVSYKAGTTYSQFPTNYGVPEGAALLNVSSDTFAYSDTGNVGTTGTANKFVSVSKIVYPAELLYYSASPVKASDNSVTTWNSLPSTWLTSPGTLAAGSWDTAVKGTSKSVALANNINYGVAQLNTSVKANATTLVAYNSDNTTLNIPIGNLKITGILVGGQPETVSFNLVSDATDEGSLDRVVYDVLNNSVLSTTASDGVKTLVYDSYLPKLIAAGKTPTNQVNFAIELEYDENASDAFKGLDGTIYPGQKFYLIGQMDASATGGNIAASSSGIDWTSLQVNTPSTYFPGYQVNRVFVQDFITNLNVNIGSLKNAYVGIPDLRSSLVQFGLSVDLTWKAGLSFDVNIE